MEAKKEQQSNRILAIEGGTPALPAGPADWPTADPDIREALLAAWSDGSWGTYHGVWVDRLTQQLSRLHAREYVLPCSSGTYAVEAALRGVGVQSGDEVVLAGYDFPGNFRAIEQLDARPVLIDIAADSWSLDPSLLDRVWSPSVRAVIVSHLHGALARIETIETWCRAREIALVEDACQVPGSEVGDRLAGSFGDVSVLSFGGSKLLTAGRGGALLTGREDVFQRAKIHGHRGNDAFPLSQLQAAVLLPQLEALEQRNRQRLAAVDFFARRGVSWSSLTRHVSKASEERSSFYKLGWKYTGEMQGGPTRGMFLQALQAEGLAIDIGFRGFSQRSDRRCRRPVPLTESELAAHATVLLHHPLLLADEVTLERAAEAFDKVHAAFFSPPAN